MLTCWISCLYLADRSPAPAIFASVAFCSVAEPQRRLVDTMTLHGAVKQVPHANRENEVEQH